MPAAQISAQSGGIFKRRGEPTAEDFCGRRGVKQRGTFVGANPGFPQCRFCCKGSQPLVDKIHFNVEPAVEALAEASCQPSGFVDCTIGMTGHADHQSHRPPFADQRGDRSKAAVIVFGRNHRQCMGDGQLQLADSDTDAFFTEIEGEYRAACRSLTQAWPATSERVA